MFKQDTLLQLLSLLDAKSIKRKTFGNLAIQMKNLLMEQKTKENNHEYEELRANNVFAKKKRLGEENRKL